LPAALVDLAWILATTDRSELRSPAEAVRLAERSVELTERKSPTALDTLAAAYAAAGNVERACATAEEALAIASSSAPRELVDHIEARLDAYRRMR
jgi:hypothetical protein